MWRSEVFQASRETSAPDFASVYSVKLAAKTSKSMDASRSVSYPIRIGLWLIVERCMQLIDKPSTINHKPPETFCRRSKVDA